MKKWIKYGAISALVSIGCNGQSAATSDQPANPTLEEIGRAISFQTKQREAFRQEDIPYIPFSTLKPKEDVFDGKMVATIGVLLVGDVDECFYENVYLLESERNWADNGVRANGIRLWVGKAHKLPERLRRMNGHWVRVTGVFDRSSGVTVLQGGSFRITLNGNGTIDANSIELVSELGRKGWKSRK